MQMQEITEEPVEPVPPTIITLSYRRSSAYFLFCCNFGVSAKQS